MKTYTTLILRSDGNVRQETLEAQCSTNAIIYAIDRALGSGWLEDPLAGDGNLRRVYLEVASVSCVEMKA